MLIRFSLFCLQCASTDLDMDDLDDCDQVTQVIGYHPRYRDHFLHTQNFIMKGDGPLPYAYRYYLAIIVSRTFVYCFHLYFVLIGAYCLINLQQPLLQPAIILC